MANVSGGKKIKGNVIGKTKPIKANVVQNKNTIKANITNSPSATEEHKGLIRIATEQEVIEGTSANTAITPRTLRLTTNYIHEQGEASNVWIINHNLNKMPQITVTDSAGNVQSGVEKYIDDNTIEIYFNNKFKGTAILT